MRAFIYQTILDAIKEEISIHPEYADLHYHYAILLIMKGDWVEARQSLRKSLSINPHYQAALEVEKDLKNWAAKDINEEKIQQNPPQWLSDAHITAARYYAQCGDIKDAETALQKAYSLTKDKALYSYHCGLLYESRGLLQQAETYLKKAISLEIECCNPYLVLSQIFALEDKWDEAKKTLEEALQKFPHYPDLHYQYGVLLMQEGNLEGAIKEIRKAIKGNPDYLFAHYQLGNLLIQKGEAQGAVEEYKTVIALGLKESQIYMDLASAQLMGDMEPEAEKTAKEAMLVDASNPEPCRFLEVLYRIRGDHKLADYYNLEKLKREEHYLARR
jgi:tetratricopeptide (TPR) repeat protein